VDPVTYHANRGQGDWKSVKKMATRREKFATATGAGTLVARLFEDRKQTAKKRYEPAAASCLRCGSAAPALPSIARTRARLGAFNG